ncbi:BTAD domain-containing putative transcriptional regulator [Kandleria sp.]|uniref:bacterial transcriptional activator domain-containing protein n=1 Tax=Kandleria sp. TaxID=2774291 RepID=UPI001B70F220|nr:BTAD domain-containing putative transcriptional regulator [Kandleria sp.]MBP3275593.1 hypothetical protein [Kandleria sp.]
MNTMRVKMIGTFEMSYNGKTIAYNDFHSSKITELLVYLFKKPFDQISNHELSEIMFKDASQDPLNALKALVYRVRVLLKEFGDEPFIISSKGYYYWNESIRVEIDLDEFEHYIQLAKKDEEINYEYYEKAVALYKGRLLPMIANTLWVKLENTYLESKVLQAMLALMIKYYEEESIEEFKEMSRKILELDVYNEKAHYYIMKQYIRENNIELARKNYKNLETLFRKDLGIDPNISLKELLHQSQQQENERRLEAIQSTFQQFKSKQAFECSAEEFRQLCEIEKRRAQRETSHYHIVDIIVKDENTKNNEALGVNLKKAIMDNLREYDCVLQYDQNKFMVLIDCEWDHLKQVIDRIKSHYYEHNGHEGKIYFQGMNIKEYKH